MARYPISSFVYILLLIISQNGVLGRFRRKQRNSDGDNHRRLSSSVFSSLRYVTFGSSVTWGAAMKHREHAYPWLLSKDTKNLALRASGPLYPAVCLQSIFDGDDSVYDVIVLEYFMRAHEGLAELAVRLRQRFPNAIIFFLQLWNPLHINFYGDNEFAPISNIKDLPAYVGEDVALHDRKFHEIVMNFPPEKIQFIDFQENEQLVRTAAEKSDGIVLPLYKPDDPRVAVSRYSHWFSSDWHHLSEKGHAAVYHLILGALEIMGIDAEEKRNQGILGNWGDGDSCISWYESGKCPLEISEGLEVKSFDSYNTKFAIEFFYGHGGSVVVNNQFDHDRDLHLTYMTTGPAPTIYPLTKLNFPTLEPERIHLTELDPTYDGRFNKPVHVAKTTKVATIPPGETVLSFDVVEEGKSAPFRLTGISITGMDYQPESYAFIIAPSD